MENFNDVSDAFDGWLQPLTGTRNTGSYVDGRWVSGVPANLSFNGVVQNATSEDLKVLDEGNRTEDAIKIHTRFELEVQSDVINYNAKTWLIYNVADRKIGGYYKAIAIKQC